LDGPMQANSEAKVGYYTRTE